MVMKEALVASCVVVVALEKFRSFLGHYSFVYTIQVAVACAVLLTRMKIMVSRLLHSLE
jgi:hypothetical protein